MTPTAHDPSYHGGAVIHVAPDTSGTSVLASVFRIVGIAGIVARHALVAAPVLVVAKVRNDKSHFHARLGKTLRAIATSVGPVAVKFAQIVSYRSDIFPEAFLMPLRDLQAAVPISGKVRAKRRILMTLGRVPEQVFSDLSPRPIAAGSVAVVFKARLVSNGQPVAIKIVRPKISVLIRKDLAALRRLAVLAGRLRAFAEMPVTEVFDDVAALIAQQSDMQAEAVNFKQLGRAIGNVAGLSVPQMVPEASGRDILTMDWVGHAHQIDDTRLSNEVFETAALSLLDGLFHMIFVDGIVHCDLHPGNILVNERGEVALLDAGLVGRLQDIERRQFKHFFFAFAQGDGNTCARLMLDIAQNRLDGINAQAFRIEVAALVKRYQGKPAGEFLIAEFIYLLFEVQRRHRLRGAPGFISAILAMGMYEGLVRQRLPDLDFQGKARDFLTGNLIEMVRPHAPLAVVAQSLPQQTERKD